MKPKKSINIQKIFAILGLLAMLAMFIGSCLVYF